jgi:hypothetical protein
MTVDTKGTGPPVNENARRAALEKFTGWCDRPERANERLAELEQLARADPDAWRDAIVGLIPDAPTDQYPDALEWGLIAVLRASPDRSTMEADLARRAHAHRTVASVVGNVLRFGSQGSSERHALDVLGETFVFDTWSRYHLNYRSKDRANQQPDVAVDYWAWELIDSLVYWDPDAAWTLFLGYLEYEDDPGCRDAAGIGWLESINFTHAAEFIDRIEAEAPTNERLRVVMRGMYPPSKDAGIERRFKGAAEEPIGDR